MPERDEEEPRRRYRCDCNSNNKLSSLVIIGIAGIAIAFFAYLVYSRNQKCQSCAQLSQMSQRAPEHGHQYQPYFYRQPEPGINEMSESTIENKVDRIIQDRMDTLNEIKSISSSKSQPLTVQKMNDARENIKRQSIFGML